MPIQIDIVEPTTVAFLVNGVAAQSSVPVTPDDQISFVIQDPDDMLGLEALVNTNVDLQNLGLSFVVNNADGTPDYNSTTAMTVVGNITLTKTLGGDYEIKMKVSPTYIANGVANFHSNTGDTATLTISKNGYTVNFNSAFSFGSYNNQVTELINFNPSRPIIGVGDAGNGEVAGVLSSNGYYYSMSNRADANLNISSDAKDQYGNVVLNREKQPLFHLNDNTNGKEIYIDANAVKDSNSANVQYGARAFVKIASDQVNSNSNYKPGTINKVSVAGKDVVDAEIKTSSDSLTGKIYVNLKNGSGDGFALSDSNLIYETPDGSSNVIATNAKVKVTGGAGNDVLEIANSSISGLTCLSGGAGDDTLILNGNGVVGIGGAGADIYVFGAKFGEVQNVVIACGAINHSNILTGVDRIDNYRLNEDQLRFKYSEGNTLKNDATSTVAYDAGTGISDVRIYSNIGNEVARVHIAAIDSSGASVAFDNNILFITESTTPTELPSFVYPSGIYV